MSITFEDFQRINAERAAEWHEKGEEWSLADWGNAMAGECGEACNVIKKIRRIETSVGGNMKGETAAGLHEDLGKELADTVTYAFLVASTRGIDLGAAITEKFNAVSEKQGLPQRISESTPGSTPESAPKD